MLFSVFVNNFFELNYNTLQFDVFSVISSYGKKYIILNYILSRVVKNYYYLGPRIQDIMFFKYSILLITYIENDYEININNL